MIYSTNSTFSCDVPYNSKSNGVMNRAISKHAAKAHGLHLDADNMAIGCAAHVENLVVQ
jgi:hypothetical protein